MAARIFLAGIAQLSLLSATITTAAAGVVSTPITGLLGMTSVSAQAVFTYGSGGTSAKYYLQTSLDGGATWFDIACWAFATTTATAIHSVRTATAVAANYTPLDATLTDNTIKDGLLGCCLRIKYTTVGTYAGGTTIAITGLAKA